MGGVGNGVCLQQKISPAHRPKRALNASSVTPPPFTSIKKSFMFCCTTMMSTMSLSICSSAIHRMEKLSITPLKNFCSFFAKNIANKTLNCIQEQKLLTPPHTHGQSTFLQTLLECSRPENREFVIYALVISKKGFIILVLSN